MNISRNNKGITLIIATAIIMALSILAISVISVTGSQAYLGQAQVDKIKSEQLAKGAFWLNYMSRVTTGNSLTAPAETLNGKTFTPSLSVNPFVIGQEGTQQVTSKVSYQ